MWEDMNPATLEELKSILGSMDWDEIRGEVEEESRARIAIVGTGDCGKSTLFNLLKGWEVSPVASRVDATTDWHEENLGLFTLIDAPAVNGSSGFVWDDLAFSSLIEADLILYVIDGAVALRPVDYEWFSRIRATGKPTIAVLNKVDLIGDRVRAMEMEEELSRKLAAKVISISAREGTGVADRLVPEILDAHPGLAVALGRELLAFRRQTAYRVMRKTAFVSGLFGVEPIPLLDMPLQVVLQMRLVLRIAAIYGEPMTDQYGKELLATLVGGVLTRYLGQQAAKLVPVLGWAASGGIAAASSWTIGQVALAYFENEKCLPLKDHLPRPPQWALWLGRLWLTPWLKAGRWARSKWRRRQKDAVGAYLVEGDAPEPALTPDTRKEGNGHDLASDIVQESYGQGSS